MSAGKRRGVQRLPPGSGTFDVWRGVMPEPRLETAALIGKGFCSDVYAWGEGRP
jgi:hypothetical protein